MNNRTFLVIRLTFGYVMYIFRSFHCNWCVSGLVHCLQIAPMWFDIIDINADDLLITHCRVVTQFWCSFITFPLYVIITQMGSSFKKSVVSEDVRNSLHGWKRRVKARQSTSSTATTHLVRTLTSSDSIVDETRKLESSSSNSSERSSFKNENTSFRHLQGGDEKLETPLSVGSVYDSYSDDNEGDYHHDDHSNIKDELALLPP